MTHGFDDEGRQYDAKGNLKDWWTKDDADQFVKHADCVVDQYAQYVVVDDIHINSKLTEGEDVADLGGTILAYIAWKDATKDMTLQERDGLTPDQRFFIGFAQWACENHRPENQRVNAITDPHSPAKISHQRRSGEHARVRQSFLVQGGAAHGQAGRKSLPRLVSCLEARD